MKKAKFNKKEALKLWSKGWCWNALGEKYGYYKDTIKKYVGRYASIEEYAEANKKHCKHHFPYCPLCFDKHHKKARRFRQYLKHKDKQQELF